MVEWAILTCRDRCILNQINTTNTLTFGLSLSELKPLTFWLLGDYNMVVPANPASTQTSQLTVTLHTRQYFWKDIDLLIASGSERPLVLPGVPISLSVWLGCLPWEPTLLLRLRCLQTEHCNTVFVLSLTISIFATSRPTLNNLLITVNSLMFAFEKKPCSRGLPGNIWG